MNLTINDQNLVELVDTWIPNPIYGDMDYEMRYTRYKDFNGVKFPMLLHVHHGDPRLNPAHNFYEIRRQRREGERAGAGARRCRRPVRTATLAPVRVGQPEGGRRRVDDGRRHAQQPARRSSRTISRWWTHPTTRKRSLALIAEADKLAPGKQIRYVVNTHHHMDHAGGPAHVPVAGARRSSRTSPTRTTT
jgi:hypothetical protein